MSEELISWLSLDWFSLELLKQEFEYERPTFLYIAIGLPIILIIISIIRFIIKSKVKVSGLPSEYSFSWLSLLGIIPWIFFYSTISLICFALARPQKPNSTSNTEVDGIDILLTIDISESMVYSLDFKPNRLEKTKVIAADFVKKRTNDNIGLVVFSGEAFAKSPPTLDKELLQELISEISSKEIEKSSTAIGDGCGLSVSLLKESKAKSKIIILLSDGENTAGNLQPLQAAALAEAFGVKVYTIGIGKRGEVPARVQVQGFFGKVTEQVRNIPNNFNEKELKEIARITGGKYYRATNAKVLENVFEEINSLEKTKIESKRYRYKTDFYHIYLTWAIITFLCFLLLRSTFMVGLHQD